MPKQFDSQIKRDYAPIFNVYAVRDKKTSTFHSPMFVNHPGIALRWFQEQIENEQSELGKHAEDYILYELGTFNASTGEFTNLETPHIIMQPNLAQ